MARFWPDKNIAFFVFIQKPIHFDLGTDLTHCSVVDYVDVFIFMLFYDISLVIGDESHPGSYILGDFYSMGYR